MRKTLVSVLWVTVALAGGTANANPVELFGFGSQHAGKANAVAASCDDYAAGYYNPAGLAFEPGKQVTFGLIGSRSNLEVDGRRLPLDEPLGIVFGASSPAPLGGWLANRVHVGLGLYLLPKTVVTIVARVPDEPFFPYYDNRTQRIVVLPTVAIRLRDDLAVGGAINFLATMAGSVTASEGATRAIEARVDEEIPSIARINAGVRWRPRSDLDVALAFRQEFAIPFSTVADNEVAGEPIDLDISADGQYTPMQLIAGTAWHPDNFELAADLVWARWSAYGGPYVRVRSELPLVGPLIGDIPEVPFNDTIAIRLGGEVFFPVGSEGGGYRLRGGYAFETSPVPAKQTGVSNLLDGYKNTLAAGAGVVFPHALNGHTLRIDAHVSAQLVAHRTITKRLLDSGETYDPFTSLRDEVVDDPGDPASQGVQISNPGYPSLRSGGQVYSGGVTVEVAF